MGKAFETLGAAGTLTEIYCVHAKAICDTAFEFGSSSYYEPNDLEALARVLEKKREAIAADRGLVAAAVADFTSANPALESELPAIFAAQSKEDLAAQYSPVVSDRILALIKAAPLTRTA